MTAGVEQGLAELGKQNGATIGRLLATGKVGQADDVGCGVDRGGMRAGARRQRRRRSPSPGGRLAAAGRRDRAFLTFAP